MRGGSPRSAALSASAVLITLMDSLPMGALHPIRASRGPFSGGGKKSMLSPRRTLRPMTETEREWMRGGLKPGSRERCRRAPNHPSNQKAA
jgi:hypothetical protein